MGGRWHHAESVDRRIAPSMTHPAEPDSRFQSMSATSRVEVLSTCGRPLGPRSTAAAGCGAGVGGAIGCAVRRIGGTGRLLKGRPRSTPGQTAHLLKITAGSRSAEPPETGFFRPSGAGPPSTHWSSTAVVWFRRQGTARASQAAPGPAGSGAVRRASRDARGSSSPHRAPRCRQ